MTIGLPEALERAASALPRDADAVRPANGDPAQLLALLAPEAAIRVLSWLLENEPEAGAELVDAWADDPEHGAPVLQAVDPTGLPKTARKALRRATHRLRSRGVAAVEAGPVAVVATLPPIHDTLEAALISALDPRGTRLAYLVEANPSGGARLFALVLDEQRGVLGCEVYTTTRSNARRLLRETAGRGSFPTVEVTPDAVRALVARVARVQPPGRTPPRSYSEWRSHLTPPEGAVPPGQLARQALGPVPASALERVRELVTRGELGPWPTAPEALQKLAESIAELAESQIIVSPARRREQAEDRMSAGLAEIFGEPHGAHIADCFEESAFVLWKRDRREDAEAALAAADAFRSVPPGDNPVAKTLLELVLAPVLGRLEERKEEEERDSLLVKP